MVREGDHLGREICVQIEADDHGQMRAVAVADTRQERALAIVETVGDHRAMEIEINRIGASDPVEDAAGDPAESIIGDRPRGLGGAPQDRLQVVARSSRGLGKARDRQVHASGLGEHLRPSQKPRPAIGHLEFRHPRLTLGERVGLMLKPGDGNPGHQVWSLGMVSVQLRSKDLRAVFMRREAGGDAPMGCSCAQVSTGLDLGLDGVAGPPCRSSLRMP